MKKLKILIITALFPPQNCVGALRPYSWAKYWSQWGHEVEVLTTTTHHLKQPAEIYDLPFNNFLVHPIEFPKYYYKFRSLFDFYPNKQNQKIDPQNISAASSPLLKHLKKFDSFRKKRGVSRTSRMPEITDLWGFAAIHWAYGHGPWDLVVSTFAPYINHIIAYQIKQKSIASKWIADFRDLWVDSHIYKGLWPFTVVEKVLERRLMGMADLITTVSEPLMLKLQQKYGFKVHLIENGFDPDDYNLLQKTALFPNDAKIRIIYTGNLYPGKSDPSPLFAAIAELMQDSTCKNQLNQLEVLFFGKNLDTIDFLIKKYNVGQFVFNRGAVKREACLIMQRQADILLFLEWDDPAAKGVLTGKLFEYLFSGTPIWGIGIRKEFESGKIISENGFGVVFEKDVQKIKHHLKQLLDNKQRVRVNSDKSSDTLDKFHRRNLAQRMIELIE